MSWALPSAVRRSVNSFAISSTVVVGAGRQIGETCGNCQQVLHPVAHFPGEQLMAFFGLLASRDVEEDTRHLALVQTFVISESARRDPSDLVAEEDAEVYDMPSPPVRGNERRREVRVLLLGSKGVGHTSARPNRRFLHTRFRGDDRSRVRNDPAASRVRTTPGPALARAAGAPSAAHRRSPRAPACRGSPPTPRTRPRRSSRAACDGSPMPSPPEPGRPRPSPAAPARRRPTSPR